MHDSPCGSHTQPPRRSSKSIRRQPIRAFWARSERGEAVLAEPRSPPGPRPPTSPFGATTNSNTRVQPHIFQRIDATERSRVIPSRASPREQADALRTDMPKPLSLSPLVPSLSSESTLARRFIHIQRTAHRSGLRPKTYFRDVSEQLSGGRLRYVLRRRIARRPERTNKGDPRCRP